MTWPRPARRAPGCSWVALVGSETIQAVSVSPSQYSKRPSQVAMSSRVMVTGRQPGNSGAGEAGRRRDLDGRLRVPASVPICMVVSGLEAGSTARSITRFRLGPARHVVALPGHLAPYFAQSSRMTAPRGVRRPHHGCARSEGRHPAIVVLATLPGGNRRPMGELPGRLLDSSSTVFADIRRLRSNQINGLLRQAKLGDGGCHVDGYT